MKKLFTIIALSLLLPFAVIMSACGGGNPQNPNGDDVDHTHSWSVDYTQTETEHYKTCSGCSETSERGAHTGSPCTVCSYAQTPATPQIAVRDLKVYTYQTTNAGVFTFVELPDGKNMLIDSGACRADGYEIEWALIKEVDSTYILSKIDYLILTNTTSYRCGGISYIEETYGEQNPSDFHFVVDNFYYLDTTGATFAISTEFTSAATALEGKSGCTHHTITDNSDITNTFLDTQGSTHEYTIDFMLPVTLADVKTHQDYEAENTYYDEHIFEYDYQAFISIEYQGKVILLTGDATELNIGDSRVTPNGGYINKYDKDVDVLITGYFVQDPYAIVNSGSRNIKSFVEDISLESGDYAIVTYLGLNYIENLYGNLGSKGASVKTFATGATQYTVTISHTDGTITVA